VTGFSEFQSEAKLGSIVKLHAGSYGLELIDPEVSRSWSIFNCC